jgi:Family of unknown function (DUF5320)
MPRFDGTGPFGQGPMGRGLGPCGAGRRSGFGSGFGSGFRGFCNFRSGLNRPRWGRGAWEGGPARPQDEVQALKQEATYLQNELDAVQKRLAEIEGA